MSRKSDFRIAVSIFALVLVLVLSFSGYYLYIKVGINQPLQKQLLAIEGVESVSLNQQGQHYKIDVNLDKVENLQKVYRELKQTVDGALPKHNYVLNLVDRPDQNLEDFMQHIQPAVYESLSNHRFIWLDQEMAQRSAAQGLKYKLFVDQENLYIQVENDDAYICQVISRQKDTGSAEVAAGA